MGGDALFKLFEGAAKLPIVPRKGLGARNSQIIINFNYRFDCSFIHNHPSSSSFRFRFALIAIRRHSFTYISTGEYVPKGGNCKLNRIYQFEFYTTFDFKGRTEFIVSAFSYFVDVYVQSIDIQLNRVFLYMSIYASDAMLPLFLPPDFYFIVAE